MIKSSIASIIDHTLLKPVARRSEIEALCREKFIFNFRSVCVNSANVAICERVCEELDMASVNICSVIGFPLGAMHTEAKLAEADCAISDGATELDLMINLSWLLEDEIRPLRALRKELKYFANKAKNYNVISKLIIETGLLTNPQKVLACELAVEAGFDFVKTCTGFNGGGATVEDIRLMRETIGSQTLIKASGGIKDLATVRAMLAAGADVIGTSSGVNIVAEETAENS